MFTAALAFAAESGRIVSASPSVFSCGQAITVTVQVQNTGDSDDMFIEADSWPSGWSVTPKNVNPFIPSGSYYNATFTVTPPAGGGSGTIVWKFYDDDIGVHPAGSDLLATYNQAVSATAETVSTPNTPTGPSSGQTGQSLSYSTGGATSSCGHVIEYRFDWGDGTYSTWSSSTSASKSWSTATTYTVRAQSRCATHTATVSSSSNGKSVTISSPPPVESGRIVSASPSVFSCGQTITVTVQVQNTGESDDMFIEADSWPAGWSVTPKNVNPFIPSGSYYNATFTVTPPAGGGSGTIVWKFYDDDIGVHPAGSDLLATYNQAVSATAETVSTPNTPAGASSGETGQSLSYSTGGATSSCGHSIEYRFDWGDGTYSQWSSSTSASKSWSTATSYTVRAQARCATHTATVSSLSNGKSVAISPPPPVESGRIVSASPVTFTGGQATTVTVQVQNTGDSDDMFIEADSWPAGWSVTPKNVNPNITSGTYYNATFTVTPPAGGGSGTIVWKFYDDDVGVHPSGSDLLDTFNQSVSALVPPTSFSGTVTDSLSGNPISGATVTWGAYSTTTSASGFYSINNISCGTAILTVSKSGYLMNSQSYSPGCYMSNLKNIQLSPDITEFGGTVTDSLTGNPIPGAIVTWGSYSTTSSTDGIYSINNISCGTAILTVSKGGYQTSSQSYTPTCNASSMKDIFLSQIDANDQISEATYLGTMTNDRSVADGSISNPSDVNIYSFTVTAGQRVAFDLDRLSGGFDTYLRLFNSNGSQLDFSDDDASPNESSTTDSWLEYTFVEAGTYYIGVSSYGNRFYDPLTGGGDNNGDTGIYSLFLSVVGGETGFNGISGFLTDNNGTFAVSLQRHNLPEAGIDPTRITWIVTHGLNSSRNAPNIQAIANALTNTRPATEQILTLDWSEGSTLSGDGECRIPLVGQWAAAALFNHGFQGTRINLIGHSWGSYVSVEISEEIQTGVNTIVGVDPAENILGGYDPEDVDEVNFTLHANYSWTFHSSHNEALCGADSCSSETSPITADESFVVSNSSHTDVVWLFAEMIEDPTGIGAYFDLERLLDHRAGPWVPNEYDHTGDRVINGGYEAVITASDDGRSPIAVTFEPTAAEITVLGNNIPIVDGDNSPLQIDGTDFGTVGEGEVPPIHTFSLRNDGGNLLALDPPTLPAGFTLLDAFPANLERGESYTFRVRMDTTVVGIKSGNFSFPNNDSDENPFNFSIKGTVTPPPTISVIVRPSPSGRSFSVDGATYTTEQTFSWVPGSSHSISTTSPQGGGAGIQYLWSGWSDGGSISHTVAPTSSTTYTVSFTTQYYLTMNEGAGGNASPSSGWHNSGTIVPINAAAINGYTFSGWTGSGAGSYSGSSSSASVTMNGPITETANFTSVPANISVTVRPNPSGRSFTVDGTTYTIAQTFSWVSGSTHSIATASPQSGGAGIQYVWSGWSDGGAISHTVAPTISTTYTANFGAEYFLTMTHGTGGGVNPSSAWYPSGVVVPINATADSGYTFNSWTGSGSGSYSGNSSSASVTMNGPITETASFTAFPSEYTYTINDGTITITGYTGPGGAVTIPSSINGLPVTSLGDSAFQNNTNLTSITIPNTVTNIGGSVFAVCTSLVSAVIPISVSNIGSGAFYGCSSLSDITIPNSVLSIGGQAFYICTSLTSISIPSSVSSIGDWAFAACSSLTQITVDATNPFYSSLAGTLFDKSQTTLIQCPGGKPGSYAIPNTVTGIGDRAFDSCVNLTGIALPNSVTKIGSFAFWVCSSLTNIALPDSVIEIGERAFDFCASLSAISVDALNPAYSSADGVLFDKGQTTLIKCPAGKKGDYTVPASVTNIGSVSFLYCVGLTSLVIPNSVTRIEDYAFVYCDSLASVYFRGNAPSIGDSVFDAGGNATVYYLAGTAGWGPTFGGRPTALWNPSPETPRQLTGMAMSNGVPRFVLNGPAGSNYLVQFSSNLVNWLPLSTHTISAGGSMVLTDPSMRNQPRRFYRAVPHGAADIILPATSGVITAPFVITNDSVHQTVQTLTVNGGRAAYAFTVATAGNYVVKGMVNAPNGATNSFFVNIDAEPQTPSMIWDIKPFTTGFEQRMVSWLGNGTTNSQFVPKVFNLGQGQHQLIIRGREAGVLLQSLTISPYP